LHRQWLGGFNSHLVNPRELEVPAATQHSNLDEFINNLEEMLLPDLARELEELSIFDVTNTRAASRFLGSDSIRSEEQRIRFPFGLHNTTTFYQEAMRFESLSALEEDLDRVLKIGEGEATTCWEAPIFDD
jgi:hypothetical protein